MQVVFERLIEGAIDSFADAHGLIMEVRERDVPDDSPSRYYAYFRGCEVAERGMLASECGNGTTPGAAIADYATKISMKTLVFGAHTPQRREIKCWRLK